jgi:class 3 adenylate cyclase
MHNKSSIMHTYTHTQDLVATLNVLFGMFDTLMVIHGVYKVETIGDAYVACSGVVDRSEWHTQVRARVCVCVRE